MGQSLEPLKQETLDRIQEIRIAYIVYSIVFGILITFFIFISVIVKKFYDELKTQNPFGTSGFQITTNQYSPSNENEALPGANVQATVLFSPSQNPTNYQKSEAQPLSGCQEFSRDSSMKSIS